MKGIAGLALAFAACAIADPRASRGEEPAVLFEDDFGGLPAGLYFTGAGALMEYHYMPECAPRGKWAVSTFLSDEASQRAWRICREGGQSIMAQTYANKARHTHPMIVAGDPLWTDYTIRVELAPGAGAGAAGVLFRYRNDRCYYFLGVDGERAVLKSVRHGSAFHKVTENVLAERPFHRTPGQYLTATASVQRDRIRAEIAPCPTPVAGQEPQRNQRKTASPAPGVLLEAVDATFPEGGIGLMADFPTRFASVVVTTTPDVKRRIEERIEQREAESCRLQAANPKPVVWKKIRTDDFGAGRNLRFGDLDGDGRIDVLIGQVVHHGPKDRNSELSCLTAITFDGRRLWQIGEPDPWKALLTNDVAFQIHDLDGDGRNEVIYCRGMEIIVADGATGKTRRKAPTPEMPKNTKPPYDKFPRILGDSLYFCDLRGTGRRADMILKDRYQSVWALNDRLEILWHAQCNTGHCPYAADIDGDGRDEVAIGYSLFDHDGRRLWTLDEKIRDHADGVALVRLSADPAAPPVFVCAASDEGFFLADLQGNIVKHLQLGHVQNPAVADFRPDLPGLETVSVNFWGSQGTIHFYDAVGDVIHDFEPFQHGSLCLPVNWTGRPGEYVMLSANADDGGLFDGRGRRVVTLPADGHPDMCYAVLDVTGDCRDELIVWDPHEMWVYTQDDSPRPGRLYKPRRNGLCNESNYRAVVSLPGWSE